MTEPKKWTSAEIITAVRKHYGAEKDGYGPEFASLQELSLHPGGGGGRADLFLVRAWGGKPKGHERITIEVKVSRSDYLREKAQPHKMQPFQSVSHRTYFATPEGIIKDTDDLGDIGHLLVTSRGVKIARRGVRNNDPESLPERAFVEAFRRASRAEARERSANDDPVSQVLRLNQEIAQLKRREIALINKDYQNSQAVNAWINILTTVGGVPCRCGGTLKKVGKADLRIGRIYSSTHEDGSQCPDGYPQADLPALVQKVLGTEENSTG